MPAFDQTLLNTLVAKELAKDKERARFEASAPTSSIPATPLSPVKSMLLGAGLDGASTYNFLHNKQGHEGNAMWQGMSPAATGLAVGLVGPALHYGLSKISPKIANLVSAQMGARQFGLGGENFYNSSSERSGDERVNQKLDPSTKFPSGSPFSSK
jgi:hypothetical protein